MVVEGGITEAICAEPIIRRLAEQANGQCTVTVCQEHADLYAGHPAVKCAIYDEDEADAQKFETVLRLPVLTGEMTLHQRVGTYAEQMNVVLSDGRPNLALTGYDLIRAQRFGICTLKKPKVAVAISQSLWASQGETWQQFCERLCRQSDCSVVILGQTKVELPAAKNLSGKLTSREAAAVLSQCDVLATTEEDYAALAVSVRIPAVVVSGSSVPAGREEFAGLLRMDVLSLEQVLSVMRQWSNCGK
jgi:ADP-heptose:LPS heptosyltransferase